MSKLIAILLLLGQFEVAVETSRGYFVAAYPDTDAGVTQFEQEIRSVLQGESGRFYPCVTYDGPTRDLMSSPLAERIGLVTNLRTGLRDPGTADAPWIVREDRLKKYLVNHPADKLNVKLVEQICLSLLPRDYIKSYPGRSGVKEFYR